MSKNKFSKTKRAKINKKTNGLCYYCGGLLGKYAGIDHVIPKIKGGSDDFENLVPCCLKCNSMKGVKTIEQFRSWIACPVTFTDDHRKVLKDAGALLRLISFIEEKSRKIVFYFETYEAN